MMGTRLAVDWSFLTPWRDVVRPLLEYVDGDELALGTMDNRLQCLRLHLNDLHATLDEAIRSYPTKLVTLREALELLGLVLHYDKLAWKTFLHPLTWDHELVSEPFLYDECLDELEPLVQLALTTTEPSRGPDKWYHFGDLYSLFTKITPEMLRVEYYQAKNRIQRLVGSRWDDAYRIPLWIVLIPEWGPSDAPRWAENVREIIDTLQSTLNPPGSTFELVSMSVMLFWAPLQMWMVDFLAEVRLANVVLKQFGLPMWHADRVMKGIALNAVTGFGDIYSDRGPTTEWLSVEYSSVESVVAVCSSVAEAKRLERLELCEVLPYDATDRAVCWRWLGYALTHRFHDSSVRDLTMSKNSMNLRDVHHFLGTSTSKIDPQLLPPAYQKPSLLRTIRLDANASICVGICGWRTLSELRLGDQDSFTCLDDGDAVVEEVDDDEPTVKIVIPGFGVCRAKCEDIIDASVLYPRASRGCQLESVMLELASCEAPALPPFMHAVGSNLLKLFISVDTKLTLTTDQATAILAACPQLDALYLCAVHVGTMSVFIDAYRNGTCQIRVLSLFDSCVSAWSMILFAQKMANVESRVCAQLEEFRYIYEGKHPVTGTIDEVIDDVGAAAFARVLQANTPLKMLDIGLSRRLYDKHHDKLKRYDRSFARVQWRQAKWAFLSILGARLGVKNEFPKKKRRRLIQIPASHRQKLATHILSFARPRLDRLVSVIYVPRASSAADAA